MSDLHDNLLLRSLKLRKGLCSASYTVATQAQQQWEYQIKLGSQSQQDNKCDQKKTWWDVWQEHKVLLHICFIITICQYAYTVPVLWDRVLKLHSQYLPHKCHSRSQPYLLMCICPIHTQQQISQTKKEAAVVGVIDQNQWWKRNRHACGKVEFPTQAATPQCK